MARSSRSQGPIATCSEIYFVVCIALESVEEFEKRGKKIDFQCNLRSSLQQVSYVEN